MRTATCHDRKNMALGHRKQRWTDTISQHRLNIHDLLLLASPIFRFLGTTLVGAQPFLLTLANIVSHCLCSSLLQPFTILGLCIFLLTVFIITVAQAERVMISDRARFHFRQWLPFAVLSACTGRGSIDGRRGPRIMNVDLFRWAIVEGDAAA